MKKPSPEQRKALDSFLAGRRVRLQPNDFGLAEERRRTPGLRREEVAVLTGVSVSWYTWLEGVVQIWVTREAGLALSGGMTAP